MKLSFVIPCYNSEKTIQSVVEEINEKLQSISGYSYEIILVNDCSSDNTQKVIENICKQNNNVIGIEHAKNFGQHAAIMDGFHFVSGDIVICLDDDGQTPANEADKLIDCINTGYDVVYAEYDTKMHSSFRNFGSMVNSKMTEILLGKPKDLYVSSYFAARRFVIEEIKNYHNSYPYLVGLVLRTTKNICNVSVHHRERAIGQSGYSLNKLIALWMNGFTSFSVLPLRIASYCGMVVAGIGFIYACITVVRRLFNPNMMIGWSSVMAVLLIIGGLILLVLGMIGEYIGRIYISINNSPQYVIRKVIGNVNYEKEINENEK